MKVILTGFEPLSERKSAYLSCFCPRTGAKQIRSAEGADTARREEEAHGGGKNQRGREKRTREGKKGANVRVIRVQLSPHGIFFENYLSSCLWLKKKKSFYTIMVFQSTLVLTQPHAQAEGGSRVPAKPRREPQGAPLFLMKHFNEH